MLPDSQFVELIYQRSDVVANPWGEGEALKVTCVDTKGVKVEFISASRELREKLIQLNIGKDTKFRIKKVKEAKVTRYQLEKL